MVGGKANPDGDDIDEPSAEQDAFPKVEDIVDSTGKVLNQQPADQWRDFVALDDKMDMGKVQTMAK